MKGLKATGVVAGVAGLFGARRTDETGKLRKRRVERVLAMTTATALVLSLMIVIASPALAHHPILEVSAVCDTSGNKVVTWTVSNGDWEGRIMTVSQVQYTDGGLSTIVAGLSLPANGSVSESITYALSDVGTKTLTVTAGWSNGGPQDVSADLSIKLKHLDCDESSTSTTKPDHDTTTTEHQTTTTEADETSTTVNEETSTTVEVTTTAAPTTTVTPDSQPNIEPEVDDEVQGTVITNTTVGDEVEAVEVLPFTGSNDVALITLAASAIALGALLVLSVRREEG
ncbi:MAG: LPXTG cell wall anchor domain-containing protein [Acidimicrobiia bacterium]